MKNIVLMLVMLLTLTLFAQNDDCMDRIMAKDGAWKKLTQTIKSPASDFTIQKRFYNALHQSLSGLKPKGWQGQFSGSFLGKAYGNPLAEFGYTLYAMMYACNGGGLELNHETNTKLSALFNRWENLNIYESVDPDNELGFEAFWDGLPTEVQPGVWQFAAQREPLGFGIEGQRKTWLFTYAGQLPWAWVSRQEFLEGRRRILLNQLKENEGKPVDARLTTELTSVITIINEQLEAGAPELKLPAAVTRSTKRHNEFLFVEPGSRGSVLLIKPNPVYFKKGLPAATPQFFKVEVTFDPDQPVSAAFAREVEKQIDVRYLQSFVGKTAPPSNKSSLSVQ